MDRIRHRAGLERRLPAGRSHRSGSRGLRVGLPRRQRTLLADLAAPGRPQPAQPRRQCRHGGLPARVFPGGAGSTSRRARARLQPARHACDDPSLRTDDPGERPAARAARHQLRWQLLRPGMAGERHHRPGARTDPAERRRRQARHHGSLHPGLAGEIRLLFRRERGGEPLAALSRAPWLRRRRKRRDGDVRRRAAQHQRPRQHERRRTAHDDGRLNRSARREYRLRQGPLRGGDRAGARRDLAPGRLDDPGVAAGAVRARPCARSGGLAGESGAIRRIPAISRSMAATPSRPPPRTSTSWSLAAPASTPPGSPRSAELRCARCAYDCPTDRRWRSTPRTRRS